MNFAERRHIAFWLSVAAGVIAVIWSSLPAGDFLERLELRSIDARFVARGALPTSGHIAIVEVDDRSLQEIGRWQWPRATFARLVRALKASGAQAIAFDIFFAEHDSHPGGAESDAELVAAAREAGCVYAAVGGAPADETQVDLDAESLARFAWDAPRDAGGTGGLQTLPNVSGPFRELAAACRGAGLVDVVPSPDGVYRRCLPAARYGAGVLPAMVLSLATDTLGLHPADVRIRPGHAIDLGGKCTVPLQPDGTMLINYAGPGHTFPYYSAADVLNHPSSLAPGTFAGKIVFIAVTAVGLYDLRACPFDAIFNGVEVQANALDNILQERFLRRQSPASTALVTLLWALVIGFAVARLAPPLWVPATVAAMLVHNLAAVWAFREWGVALAMVTPSLGMACALVLVPAYQISVQERRHKELEHVLGRFVPPEVASRLTQADAEPAIAGELRTVTVLFADLRGFTSASARMNPQDTTALLNRYFRLMHEVIFSFGGTLDKFIGDGLMAFFNAPLEQVDHAHLAVATALEMQRQVDLCRDEWAFFGMPELAITIGISTGQALVGYVGSGERMQYTAIGADVNVAARLEELAKELDVRILISESTHRLVSDMVECRDLGPHRLHGVPDPVEAYEVLQIRDAEPAGAADGSASE
jgi:adenylate cyclase